MSTPALTERNSTGWLRISSTALVLVLTLVTVDSRAFDDSGNFEIPSSGATVTILGSPTCPCSLWNASSVPPQADDGDAGAVELGMRFRADLNGYVTGVRFYKASLNTGTHVGRLWSNTGTLLAKVTFTGESASGWQQATFASPVAISANTTYVVSYHAPHGHYTGIDGFFANSLDNPPLRGLRDGVDGANGVYQYGSGGFPTETYESEAYWVDVVFITAPPLDTTPPRVSSMFPAGGSTGVDPAAAITATFSEAMDPAFISTSTAGMYGTAAIGTFELRDPSNILVIASVSYDAASRAATLRPAIPLAASTTFKARVKGGTVDPRVKDLAGNAMAASVIWTFTTAAAPPPSCPCGIWNAAAVPPHADDGDAQATEVGTRFRSDSNGYITGIRFYKASLNTGTHVGRLWSNTGTLLGSVTFTGETASGWQQATFPFPIAISANTTYVVSYHAPKGHYTGTDGFFAAAGLHNPPLHALRDGVDGPNGVYVYGAGGFPTETYQSEAYWVDVVFNTTSTADSVLYWNEVMTDANAIDHTPPDEGESRIFGEQLGPARTSLAFAIVHIAIFDAVNAIAGGYQSYTGLDRAPDGTSVQAAVAQAAHDTLAVLFPSQQPRFAALLAEDLRRIPAGPAKENGIEVGRCAAEAILALRADDGSDHPEPVIGVDYFPGNKPGKWRPDPISQSPLALGARWRTVKPLVIASATQFRIPPPPALASFAYAVAFDEVKALGGDGVTTPTVRTLDQTIAGIYWAYDGTPELGTPPRLYNQIVAQLARERGESVGELARLFALINVAMADTALAAWESKYYYRFWRPITGIRESDPGTGPTGAGDGNPLTVGDVNFTPLGAPASNTSGPNFTPPFPAYPSGHATLGSAIFQILRHVYGTDDIAFTFVSDEFNGKTRDNEGRVRPRIPRTFGSLSHAEEENGQSRIYLGIHWAFDKTEGTIQGRNVADYVFGNAFVASSP
jgi:hypothetical protein